MPLVPRTAASLALVLLGACAPAPQPAPTPAAAADAGGATRVEADVRFLADDLLEGREAGTRGHDLAARYVAARFAALGLVPAGDDGGWFQQVPMLRGVRLREGARFAIERDGRTTELAFEDDFLPGISFSAPAVSVSAPMVFLGYGVHAPEFGWDDYAGVEVEGKIAVLVNRGPASLPNDQRAFYSSSHKMRELEARGAVGYVMLSEPEKEARRPWTVDAPGWRRPGMRLLDESGAPVEDFPGLRGRATMRSALLDTLLEGSGVDAEAVWAAVKAGTPKSFDLAGTLTLANATALDRVISHNVVAKLPGTDAALAGEHVVLSAHLDHIGIGAGLEGDAIFNGALDNALGIAVLLEAARGLQADPPRRSVLFLATTAEEKGLLCAYQFARAPTVPKGSLVANVNMDMPVILSPLADAVPIGLEHSSLQAVVERVAAKLGIALSPDPLPEEVVFIRSDQYAFIREGIPAVYLDGGIRSESPGADAVALMREFLDQHYHRPSDDLSRPIHWPTAARLAQLNEHIAREIGNAQERPRWNAGDFFGEMFGTEATRAP